MAWPRGRFGPITPEELIAMADVVATGEVKSIKATGKHGVRIEGSRYPLEIMEATVQAIHATKGEIPITFELRYPQFDDEDFAKQGEEIIITSLKLLK